AEFHPRVVIASRFGAEDVVLIDMAGRAPSPFRVFTLDTDFLFAETYALIEHIEQRYGIQVERCRSALTPEEQARQYGDALWSSQPDQRCTLRKVQPLKAKRQQFDAWRPRRPRDAA